MNSYEYYPAYEGNRDSDSPFSVEIKLLSRADITAYSELIAVESVPGFRNQTKSNAGKIQKRQFTQNVGAIKGLTDELTGQAITTADQLYEAPGFDPLITEIIQAMEDRSKLSEGLEKNLWPLSGTSSSSPKSGEPMPTVQSVSNGG